MLLPALLFVIQTGPAGDYWPGPWVVFTDGRWRGDAPPIVADVAQAARRLPDVRLPLCAEGVRGGDAGRVAAVRGMLEKQGVASRRLSHVVCRDRDLSRPAGVRIAIL